MTDGLQETVVKKTFGERVRERREELSLSGPALARALGIDTSTLYSLETGKTKLPGSPELIEEYAKLLRVSPSWLMGYADEKKSDISPDVVQIEGVPVVGAVELGAFRAKDAAILTDVFVPRSPDPRYVKAQQVALQVKGNAVNQRVQDGSFVIATPFAEARHQPAERDLVVISLWHGAMRELTVREVSYTPKGFDLRTPSTDAACQDVLSVDANLVPLNRNGIHVDFDYLVIGFFVPV